MEKNNQNNSKTNINITNNTNNNLIIENNTIDNSNEEITIKIQTLDNIYPIIIKKNASVNDLKEKLFEVYFKIKQDVKYPYTKATLNFSRKMATK